jgi:hypothetical protein
MFDYRRVSLSFPFIHRSNYIKFDWLFSMVSHTLGAIQKNPKTTEVNLKEELEESCSFWLDGALNVSTPKVSYCGTLIILSRKKSSVTSVSNPPDL